jgi:hypothetical protein
MGSKPFFYTCLCESFILSEVFWTGHGWVLELIWLSFHFVYRKKIPNDYRFLRKKDVIIAIITISQRTKFLRLSLYVLEAHPGLQPLPWSHIWSLPCSHRGSHGAKAHPGGAHAQNSAVEAILESRRLIPGSMKAHPESLEAHPWATGTVWGSPPWPRGHGGSPKSSKGGGSLKSCKGSPLYHTE